MRDSALAVTILGNFTFSTLGRIFLAYAFGWLPGLHFLSECNDGGAFDEQGES